MTTKAPYSWRVFTAEANGGSFDVVSTMWTSDGPQDEGRNVLMTFTNEAEAVQLADATQREYDTVRRAFDGTD